jgi:hypothetical protein
MLWCKNERGSIFTAATVVRPGPGVHVRLCSIDLWGILAKIGAI